ncbi:hypothetical protein FGL97_01475 [Pseudomonas putida]|uniref:hypothetical protein n=1 Tax=Pseudomonas putida TaxID=303 RepID=UPI00159E1DAC|nr:hypothetical protein [Pseudomonas putida]NVN61920.1 hypothetical protein [Pseudomonas putida]NVN66913.1 hypothetical protein [Pseudomonas putida]
MTAKEKNLDTPNKQKTPPKEDDITAEKSCFVMMPIADMDGYEPGHFRRVYEHLIKPACIAAGYTAHRADFVAASNYIIIDILKKIIESDIVICDLSGRNPNVLYELGVRQAFNLPTVLIKDTITSRIFDIQGLRTTEYSHTLRIDEVQADLSKIALALSETAAAPNDINSMIQLLGTQPAQLPHKIEVSEDTSLILASLNDISSRISNLESNHKRLRVASSRPPSPTSERYTFNSESFSKGDELFINGTSIGRLFDLGDFGLKIENNGKIETMKFSDPVFSKITGTPF